MVAVGIQGEPANNDVSFVGQFLQSGYTAGAGDNPISVSIPFANTQATASDLRYGQPWGVLLLAKAAKTAANSATGLDQTAQTLKGGYMCYQVFAGNGTAALKVQHASTNSDGSFSDLLSTGTIACTAPVAGIVALDPHATVERYVRWQIALGTASTVTFALTFVRNHA